MAKKVNKKDLGMGIRALLTNVEEEAEKDQEKVVKELSQSVALVPIEQIEVNPFQPRNDFDPESLEELAQSIATYGLIQPLTLRRLGQEAYQLISGERRLRAAKMAGLEGVPAYIRIANDQEMLEMALVENIQREELNAVEIAITYQRLIEECQLTHEKLSERVGKKRATITNHLRLLKLPPDIQGAIKERKLTMGHARALAGIEDVGLRQLLFRKTLQKSLSVRALEKLIQSYQQPQPKAPPKPELDSEYQDVQQQFRSFFGTKKVQLQLKSDGKGQIVIPFSSVDELNGLIDRIDE